MPKLTLEELKERDLALRVARDPEAGPMDLPDEAWAYLQRFAEKEVVNLRSLISDAEKRPQRIDKLRSELDDALYRSGESDTHPLLYPKPPAPRTVQAGDLCARHLGLTVRVPETDETFFLVGIEALKGGRVNLNHGGALLTSDTVLTILPVEGSPDAETEASIPAVPRVVNLIPIQSEPTEEFLLLGKKVRLLYDLFVASLVDYAEDNGIHDEVMADAVQFSLGDDIALSYSDELTERES